MIYLFLNDDKEGSVSVKKEIYKTLKSGLIVQCDCCKISDNGEILSTMPDICIAYKLHLESQALINMYDWLQVSKLT